MYLSHSPAISLVPIVFLVLCIFPRGRGKFCYPKQTWLPLSWLILLDSKILYLEPEHTFKDFGMVKNKHQGDLSDG